MTAASPSRRYVVEDATSWLGWVVRARGQERLAVFFKRRHAREYRDALNDGKVRP